MYHENYDCDICGVVFGSANNLPASVGICDGDDDFNYSQVCERCVNKLIVFIENELMKKYGEHHRNLR